MKSKIYLIMIQLIGLIGFSKAQFFIEKGIQTNYIKGSELINVDKNTLYRSFHFSRISSLIYGLGFQRVTTFHFNNEIKNNYYSIPIGFQFRSGSRGCRKSIRSNFGTQRPTLNILYEFSFNKFKSGAVGNAIRFMPTCLVVNRLSFLKVYFNPEIAIIYNSTWSKKLTPFYGVNIQLLLLLDQIDISIGKHYDSEKGKAIYQKKKSIENEILIKPKNN